jgi:hypothetical protein
MLVSSFNLSQSFNDMPCLFYKNEINSFCIWTRFQFSSLFPPLGLSLTPVSLRAKKGCIALGLFSVHYTQARV